MHPNSPPQPGPPARPPNAPHGEPAGGPPPVPYQDPPTVPQQALAGAPTGVDPTGVDPTGVDPTGVDPDESAPPPPRRRRRLLVVLAVLVAVAAVVAAILVTTGSDGTSPGADGALGPAAGSALGEERGRRPITQIEPSGGRQLTVAQDGSGQFGTIADAAREARPGDTVVIAAGTYEGPLDIPTDGAPDAYITYHAAPGAEVVLTGEADGQGLVQLEDRQWIRFVGITIRDSSAHGLYAAGSSNIVLQDVEIDGTQDGGAVFIDGADVRVLNSEVRGTNARGLEAENEAVSFSGVDGFEIAWSIVEDNGEEGIDAKYEARNGSIHDNLTRANRGPNIYIDGANNVAVFNNEVLDATGETKAGISLGIEDLSETRSTAAIEIYNNVISGNDGGISFFVESEGTFSDISIINNTIVDNSGAGIDPQDHSFAGTNVLRNNVVTGHDRDGAGDMDVFAADRNLFGDAPVGTDPVEGEVLFADAENGDYRLAEGSAGIDAGSSDGVPQSDLLGAARPEGEVDLGAYEGAVVPEG
ncbi:right-handed parallel beta-helix repeat-containing protein [Pseudonocardia hydrocarbonoxydans]|uniref:Right handed beta helix domain-containing protein n=1 Tax=Pseudonocardia hydrocarbonoxydans TaxID=76726 RepID=A0A4Y3WMI3_9PSEU|nr:right-handed parallel beta-helix repeat-containing protein [Pseudonocardia hydrocarbonoxydans]GEC19688.1 hypothetical protein PHY01_19710 [Pseudonocardia hydrocarbonoxydans]